jgi:hypothetical protein
MPTLTVEQQGMIELAEAQERQRREQEAAGRRATVEEERRSDGEDEEEVHKARAWDDFRDANPAGSGNSKLRPCA